MRCWQTNRHSRNLQEHSSKTLRDVISPVSIPTGLTYRCLQRSCYVPDSHSISPSAALSTCRQSSTRWNAATLLPHINSIVEGKWKMTFRHTSPIRILRLHGRFFRHSLTCTTLPSRRKKSAVWRMTWMYLTSSLARMTTWISQAE